MSRRKIGIELAVFSELLVPKLFTMAAIPPLQFPVDHGISLENVHYISVDLSTSKFLPFTDKKMKEFKAGLKKKRILRNIFQEKEVEWFRKYPDSQAETSNSIEANSCMRPTGNLAQAARKREKQLPKKVEW